MSNADIFAVAPIRCFEANTEIGQATGFFYDYDQRYFITNRHVVIDENEDYYPDELRLLLHKKDNIKQNEIFSIPLYDTYGNNLWLEHPEGSEVDVVALPIDWRNSNKLRSQYYVISFSLTDTYFPNIEHQKRFGFSEIDLAIGEDLLVIGYPLGFRDTINNFPIARNATLASVFDVPFEGKLGFLIDSRLHKGTSGSPVLTKTIESNRIINPTSAITPRRFLLGVHSETLDILDRDETDEPLGLNFVWYGRLIIEIIKDWQRKKATSSHL